MAGLWQDLHGIGWADRAEGNGAAEENFTAQSWMRTVWPVGKSSVAALLTVIMCFKCSMLVLNLFWKI